MLKILFDFHTDYAEYVCSLVVFYLTQSRLSEDDVSVLRKELVHAQQLMDTITQEKEEKIKKDIGTIHDMEQDHKK